MSRFLYCSMSGEDAKPAKKEHTRLALQWRPRRLCQTALPPVPSLTRHVLNQVIERTCFHADMGGSLKRARRCFYGTTEQLCPGPSQALVAKEFQTKLRTPEHQVQVSRVKFCSVGDTPSTPRIDPLRILFGIFWQKLLQRLDAGRWRHRPPDGHQTPTDKARCAAQVQAKVAPTFKAGQSSPQAHLCLWWPGMRFQQQQSVVTASFPRPPTAADLP